VKDFSLYFLQKTIQTKKTKNKNKEISALNNTVDQMDLTEVYEKF
jgi:hypothetical protein